MKLPTEKGIVLLFSFIIMVMLAQLTVTFLNLTSLEERNVAYMKKEKEVFWIAEAGLHRAVWFLEHTAPDGSTDGSWRGSTTESFAGGSYTLTVSNLYLEDGTSPYASSQQFIFTAANAVDNNTSTSWRSQPPLGAEQWIVIPFPTNSNYYLNQATFRSYTSNGCPEEYYWEFSSDGIDWITIPNEHIDGNAQANRTDTFSLRSGVNYVRLRVVNLVAGTSVRIREIEIPAIQMNSASTASLQSRTLTETITQKGIVDTGPQVYAQPNSYSWVEAWLP
jgi:hypothetical protein